MLESSRIFPDGNFAMPIPSLSEAGIRRQTIPQSFARGRNYYQQGAVVSVCEIGGQQKAFAILKQSA